MPTDIHGDATPTIFKNAKLLRKVLTPAEKLFWDRIKNRQLNNCKFRRQHALSLYIADFYCHEAKLVIELDGGYHNTKDMQELDEYRTKVFEDFGITVLRYENKEVLNCIDKVLLEITAYLTSPPSLLS